MEHHSRLSAPSETERQTMGVHRKEMLPSMSPVRARRVGYHLQDSVNGEVPAAAVQTSALESAQHRAGILCSQVPAAAAVDRRIKIMRIRLQAMEDLAVHFLLQLQAEEVPPAARVRMEEMASHSDRSVEAAGGVGDPQPLSEVAPAGTVVMAILDVEAAAAAPSEPAAVLPALAMAAPAATAA